MGTSYHVLREVHGNIATLEYFRGTKTMAGEILVELKDVTCIVPMELRYLPIILNDRLRDLLTVTVAESSNKLCFYMMLFKPPRIDRMRRRHHDSIFHHRGRDCV